LKPGVPCAQAVAAFRGLRTPDVSAGGVNLVLAFGAAMWREVAPTMVPEDMAPFEPVMGAMATVPPPPSTMRGRGSAGPSQT
jgi:hypothetical protein